MPTVNINLNDFPGFLADKADQFPFAASRALNDTAFDVRRGLISGGERDLTFRKSARPALGVQVEKSTKRDLEAVIFSDRGWLEHQVQSGTNRPISGIKYKGKSYLLIPAEGAKTARGKLKLSKTDQPFAQKINGSLVLMARRGKKRDNIRPLGILVTQAEYADDLDWEGHANRAVAQVMPRHFAKRLDQALGSRR